MSASREKKTRQGSTYAQRRNNKAEEKSSRMHVVYGVIGVVIAILAIALLVWDSGFFQKRATAVTIDGEDFTPATVQYYYANAYSQIKYYTQMGSNTGFDVNQDPKDQVKDEESGETWHDYFLNQAVDSLTQVTMINHSAQKEGYTLSAVGQAYVEQYMEQTEQSARSAGYSNLESYLRANYGSYMTAKIYEEILTAQVTASYYETDHQNGLTYSDEELESYYQENKNSLDTFNFSVFTVQASVETTTTDEEGNTVDLSDEEKQAAFDTAKAEAQATAQEIQSKLAAGSDAADLAEEYSEKLYSSSVHQSQMGSAFSSSDYAEWLYDTARQSGETTIVENDDSDNYVYNYYVVQIESRQRDEAATADIRHILVSAGSAPTDEQFAQAEEKAQSLLDSWKSGSADEESFALMAVENTADSGSQMNGGLYTGVSPYSGYVEEFANWCLDSSRQPGDTGLVKNTGSSTQGWHIMYFVGWNDPAWKVTAKNALASEATQEWVSGLYDGVEAQRGSGINYVK